MHSILELEMASLLPLCERTNHFSLELEYVSSVAAEYEDVGFFAFIDPHWRDRDPMLPAIYQAGSVDIITLSCQVLTSLEPLSWDNLDHVSRAVGGRYKRNVLLYMSH